MNRFAKWRQAQGASQEGLAAQLGVSQGYISRLLSGERQPGRAVALAIALLTKGAVPAESWGEAPTTIRPHRRNPARPATAR